MSAPKAKEKNSLDALQSLVNDVLVQTGKALRASRKDANGNFAQAPGTFQVRLPDTISAFHYALDDLESQIIGAKSALLRDLKQVREKKKLLAKPEPQPVEPQSKDPMTLDLDSPTEQDMKEDIMMEDHSVTRMAPFPDMSIGLSGVDQVDANMKEPNPPPQLAPTAPMNVIGPKKKMNPNVSSAAVAPMSEPERKPTIEMRIEMPVNTMGVGETSGMNFTNMQFSLAPTPTGEPADQQSSKNESAFDLTAFTPNDGGGGMVMNNMMSTGAGDRPGITTLNAPVAGMMLQKSDSKNAEVANADMNEVFNNDSGTADGMDFDFSLGGGDENYDDLGRDGTFELMEPGGDFDTAFFGLDNADGS